MSRARTMARARHFVRALARDRQGMAVVEFAFLATFMIFIYLGSLQLADAIFANRKVTVAVRAVTDLTTQYSDLTTAELDSILAVSTQVLSPYDAENAQIRVSEISVDDEGNASVAWSRGLRIEGLELNDDVDLPEDLAVPGTSLIFGEIYYEHVPTIQGYSVGTLELSDQIFMSPRVSETVNLN
jgi:Flp pilus assembly protein TadG